MGFVRRVINLATLQYYSVARFLSLWFVFLHDISCILEREPAIVSDFYDALVKRFLNPSLRVPEVRGQSIFPSCPKPLFSVLTLHDCLEMNY